jgi:hypothetical protein
MWRFALRSRYRWHGLFGELRHLEAEGARDAGAVALIGAQTIGDVPLFDVLSRVAYRSCRSRGSSIPRRSSQTPDNDVDLNQRGVRPTGAALPALFSIQSEAQD